MKEVCCYGGRPMASRRQWEQRGGRSSLQTQRVKEGRYEFALPIGEELRDIEAPEKVRAS